MMRNKTTLFQAMLGLVIILGLGLTACQPTIPGAAPTAVPTAQAETDFAPMVIQAPNCDYGGEFKSIEAIDKYTVRFTLCKADPAFLSKVAFAIFSIQDKEFLDANQGSSVSMSENPNGTGPYRVKQYIRGEQLVLEANPDYWGVPSKAKTIIFKWSQEPSQRLLELRSGAVDGIDNPSADDFSTIQSDTSLKLYNRQALNIFYIGLNNTIPPFNNESVRQAFAQAIDRQRIVEDFYPAGSTVAEQFVPPALTPGYTDNLSWYNFNPTQARQLLDAANFDYNQEITLSLRDVSRIYLQNPTQVAQDIQAQLADIGVKVRINVMDSAAFLDSVAAGNEAMFLLGWSADYPDATNFYDFHFTGASKNFGQPFADLESEIRLAGATTDATIRSEHYAKVNEMIKKHVPMIPVAHAASSAAFKATIQNVTIGPLNENFEEMSSYNDQIIFVQNAEPISLWPGDETDGETIRPALLIYSTLARYRPGGVEIIPDLAEKWDTNNDLTQWTFTLRREVRFTNGAALDANDVVATFAAQWDARSPNHTGNSGAFEYFQGFFGNYINAGQ